MKQLKISELDRCRPVHLAGIAGSAMNGLATVLRDLGFQVIGTDPRADAVRDQLAAYSIEVYSEQDGSRIPENAGLVVASAALPPSHPEVSAAEEMGIPVISYAACVGLLMAERRGVAVAGTHGKTTVTSMIVSILRKQGLDPGFVIGGRIPALGIGAKAGDGDLFVAEACEYKRSFLHFHPKIAVLTGIEADHLDIYGSLENVKQAFAAFCNNLPNGDGVLIYASECPNTPSVIRSLDVRKFSFGIETRADLVATGLEPTAVGIGFSLTVDGHRLGTVRLAAPGRHNVANALAAIAACRVLGIDPMTSAAALEDFTGAGRRFEIRGDAAGVTIVDDYAHHPTALKLVLEAARQRFPGRRIVLAFQPHQYSRTLQLLDDFAAAVTGADQVVIPNIYFARDKEADVKRFDSGAFEQKIRDYGTPAVYLGGLEKLTAHLLEILRPGDVLLTAGAGDIDSIIEPLLKELTG